MQPDIFAVSEIDAGDALAIATRFALQWGYRGGQAVFWKPAFVAGPIRDTYLPFSPLRPFERRGLVRVDLQLARASVGVFATQIGPERDQRIREWRYVRNVLRTAAGPALVFCLLPQARSTLSDLGFVRVGCRGVDDECVFARGFAVEEAADDTSAHRGTGTAIVARTRLTERV